MRALSIALFTAQTEHDHYKRWFRRDIEQSDKLIAALTAISLPAAPPHEEEQPK